MMAGFQLLRLCRSIIVGGGLCLASLASAAPVPADNTLAFELFRMEAAATSPPAEVEGHLRTILNDAFASLGPNPRPPATAAQFLDFAERVGISFARHNLIQPVWPVDWPESLGQALRPVGASHPNLAFYLADGQNAPRRRYLDASAPYYYVDCDMAVLLLISTAQMVGFELHLVHAPDHEFVRWEDGRGVSVNWDWTRWSSISDEDYRRLFSISPAQVNRGVYLTSQSMPQATGYYVTAMSRVVPDRVRRLDLLRRAAPLAANNPVTASNFAWLFATTTPGITPEERRDALVYGLTGWASAPDNPAQMNAAACAFAARGERDLAIAVQMRAMSGVMLGSRARYEAELDRMRRGELC